MTFIEKLNTTIERNSSLLCIGLDTDLTKIPKHLRSKENPVEVFNKAIIDTTHDLVCAYKINIAFYEALGEIGLRHLHNTVEYILTTYPEIPVIVDAKRNDIGNSAEQYASAVFKSLKADAVTINPYLGTDSVQPFLKFQNKGIIILCRTSNPSSSEFQDLVVDGKPLYIKVAEKVIEWNKSFHNCLMVVGATWPEQMAAIRKIAPEMNFLVPGIGKQGGNIEQTLKAGLRSDKAGLIINAGRSIIYASTNENFDTQARLEAQKLKNEINFYR